MQLFQIILLFVVAELSCLRHPVVYGEGSLEISSQNTDVQTHRSKRWLWPGKVISLAFKLSWYQHLRCSSLFFTQKVSTLQAFKYLRYKLFELSLTSWLYDLHLLGVIVVGNVLVNSGLSWVLILLKLITKKILRYIFPATAILVVLLSKSGCCENSMRRMSATLPSFTSRPLRPKKTFTLLIGRSWELYMSSRWSVHYLVFSTSAFCKILRKIKRDLRHITSFCIGYLW